VDRALGAAVLGGTRGETAGNLGVKGRFFTSFGKPPAVLFMVFRFIAKRFFSKLDVDDACFAVTSGHEAPNQGGQTIPGS